ncbi:MAG: 3-hydroxyacyl-CoA dehydrogenase NAD-binding domain-containing protein, partial [Actinomycetota bacterium]|nr:3-hydroxyacyl-CoA dehydrogenase NAD-binding domain-containing protein [Actinomycetota bacterium]
MTTMENAPAGPRPEIERVGVVGAGLMGSGIAEVCSRAGLAVTVLEVSPEACERGRARLVSSLDRGVRSGKLSEGERDAALARLAFTTDFDELGDRQLVVEAVIEDEALKTGVFRQLDKAITDPTA